MPDLHDLLKESAICDLYTGREAKRQEERDYIASIQQENGGTFTENQRADINFDINEVVAISERNMKQDKIILSINLQIYSI